MSWNVEVLVMNQKKVIQVIASTEIDAKVIANNLGYKVLQVYGTNTAN